MVGEIHLNVATEEKLKSYRKAFSFLDKEFKKIEKHDDLFFFFVGCWEWIRHDQLSEVARHKILEHLDLDSNYDQKKSNLKSKAKELLFLLIILIVIMLNKFHNPIETKKASVLIFSGARTREQFEKITLNSQKKSIIQEYKLNPKFNFSNQNIYRLLSFKDVFQAICYFMSNFKKARELSQIKIRLSSVVLGVLHFLAIKRYIEKVQPDAIIIAGSINNPFVRRIGLAASNLKIEDMLIVKKTYFYDSISGCAGVKTGNEQGIPQKIYLPNKFSVDQIVQRGLDKQKLITCKFIHSSNLNSQQTEEAEHKVLILILGVNYKQNVELIEMVTRKKIPEKFTKCYLKPHPTDCQNYNDYSNITKLDDNGFNKTLEQEPCVCISLPSNIVFSILQKQVPVFVIEMSLNFETLENFVLISKILPISSNISHLSDQINALLERRINFNDKTFRLQALHQSDDLPPEITNYF